MQLDIFKRQPKADFDANMEFDFLAIFLKTEHNNIDFDRNLDNLVFKHKYNKATATNITDIIINL